MAGSANETSPLDGLLVVPEPLRGWRFFAVEGCRFTGLWHRGPEAYFRPDDRGWHKAACNRTDVSYHYWAAATHAAPSPTHAAPQLDCQCGFWAVARRECLAEVVGRSWTPGGSSGNAAAVARVELAGRIIVHTEDGRTVGWRAEQLRVVAWWPLFPWLRRVGRRVEGLAGWAERLLGAGPDCRHCGAPGCQLHRLEVTCRACNQPGTVPGCWTKTWRSSDARGEA